VAADRRRLASSKSMGAGGIPIPWRTSNNSGGSPASPFAAAAAKEEEVQFAAVLNADLLRVASAPVGAPVQKRLQDEARCEAMLARVDSMSGDDEGSDASEQSDSTATPFDDHHARGSSARAESLQKPLDLLVLQH